MITYPLGIPGSIGPIKADLTKFDKVGEFIGEFDGSAQQQQWQDQHWELELAWPEMTWAQFGPLDAFSGALFGKFGSFLFGPPLARVPQGNPQGTPVITSGNVQTNAEGISETGGICSIVLPGILTPTQLETLPGSVASFSEFAYAVWLNGTQATILSADNELWSPNPLTRLQTHGVITFAFNHADFGKQLDPAGEVAIALPGVNQSGSNQILTGGWLPSASGLLLPADFFQAAAPDSSGTMRTRLYQYINPLPLASDAGGNALIDLWPNVRETLPNGTPLTLINPQGEFRLATTKRPAPIQRNRMFTFDLKCREAI